MVSDLRLGQQGATVACDWSKVNFIHDRLLVGIAGLGTDVTSLHQRLQYRHAMYELREGRSMEPSTFGRFLSNLLYQGRFAPYFCEPVIAGLSSDGSPYVAGMDLIGAMCDIRPSQHTRVASRLPTSLTVSPCSPVVVVRAGRKALISVLLARALSRCWVHVRPSTSLA